MKKKNHDKNSILIFLCITIISLVFGFVFLSARLKEVKKGSSLYRVVFSNIEKVSSIKGGKVEPVSSAKIVLNGHELEMDFELSDIHDEIVYTVSIKNEGNLTVKVLDIIKSSDKDIDYPMVGIQNIADQDLINSLSNKNIQILSLHFLLGLPLLNVLFQK